MTNLVIVLISVRVFRQDGEEGVQHVWQELNELLSVDLLIENVQVLVEF